MSDVIATLEADHRRVEALFKSYRLTTDEQRPQVLSDIVRELSVHAALEEQIVYPAIRAKLQQGSEEADHAIDEHQQIKQLLSDLERLDMDSAEHGDRFEGLIAAVQEHVSEEEGELFPQLRSALEPERLDQMGSLVDKARDLMPTHPHPNVPGTATAQLLAAPLASMTDHIRDFLGGLRGSGDS
ncbi:MAG: hemerythrin domain-containing protein [Actinobacteria bacterium]|nr:hemerythrin domain-containing protein [Actinomycetota bacterium]